MVENIKNEMAKVKYMACTSDIWTKDRRSFIAVNAHWIDESSGELKDLLLACDRFRGNHTGVAIENKIKFILNKFGIQKKIVGMTTDNASNYTCAFERDGDNYQSYAEMMATVDDDENAFFQLDLNDLASAWCPTGEFLQNSSDNVMPLTAAAAAKAAAETPNTNTNYDESDDECDFDEMGSIRINNLPDQHLKNILDPAIDINLPSRISCAAHTLNLIGKLDSFNALADQEYSERYISVFTKLNLIWKHASTRLGRELFARYLNGKVIYKPHRIRWNRIYDAV